MFNRHDETKWKISYQSDEYGATLCKYIQDCFAPFPQSVQEEGSLGVLMYASNMSVISKCLSTSDFHVMLMDICSQIQFYRTQGFGFIGFCKDDIVCVEQSNVKRFIILSCKYMSRIDTAGMLQFPFFSHAPDFMDGVKDEKYSFPLIIQFKSSYRSLGKYFQWLIVKHDIFVGIKLEGFLRRLGDVCSDCVMIYV